MALFEDGFEGCDFTTDWTGSAVDGATIACSTDADNNGTYGARMAALDDVNNFTYYWKDLGSGYDELYVRGYVRIVSKWAESTWNAIGLRMAAANNATQFSCGPVYDGTGWKWFARYRTGAGSWVNVIEDNYSTINDNAFYCLEARYKRTATANITLWINGAERLTNEPADPSAVAFQLIGGMVWINNALASAITVDHDDFVIDTSYIGPISVGVEMGSYYYYSLMQGTGY